MPNYATHALMANRTKIISEIAIEKELIRAYAIGPDLMLPYPHALDLTHNKNTKAFFINLITKIKTEKLEKNSIIICYLYGQILHYALDTVVHPYIYYITNDMPHLSLVDFHMIVEEYIGNYLFKEYLNHPRESISSTFYTNFQWNQDKKLKFYINSVYEQTYNIRNAIVAQKITEKIIKSIDKTTKPFQRNNGEKYLHWIGLDKYLAIAKMTRENLINKKHEIWYHPITEEQYSFSIPELIDIAISFGQELIESVNKVIYKDLNISSLEDIFDNRSYDTGLSCEIGKPWARSRIKDLGIF